MTEAQATLLARALSGEAWNSGGGVWLVTLHTGGGLTQEPARFVVFSEEMVCEYASEEAFEESQPPLKTIHLQNQNAGDRWVIQDREGHVLYQDDELELGWTDECEAQREARGPESRGEGKWRVREQ
jgi:hypothetical protein